MGGGGGAAAVPLLWPMLIPVYYISIDFLACAQAIDTGIYHANCRSTPGQELKHWSMWHQEKDKAAIRSLSALEEDECFCSESSFLQGTTFEAHTTNLLAVKHLHFHRLVLWVGLIIKAELFSPR